jgi:hypothetical protein
MKILLERIQLDPDVTIGRMTIGTAAFWTCEDAVREVPGQSVETWKIAGKTAIPAGTYAITMTMSRRMHRMLPELHDVPGFTGIRIHPLNFATETEGCIGPGMDRLPNGVGRSRDAQAIIFDLIRAAETAGEQVLIEITNGAKS